MEIDNINLLAPWFTTLFSEVYFDHHYPHEDWERLISCVSGYRPKGRKNRGPLHLHELM